MQHVSVVTPTRMRTEVLGTGKVNQINDSNESVAELRGSTTRSDSTSDIAFGVAVVDLFI